MLEWIETTMASLGYPGVALLMFLENVFPPLPSELIMPLAGFTASQGKLNFAGVVLAGTLGSLLGALPLYYLGRVFGEERLAAWAERYGRWLAVSAEDIRKADRWFDRHGVKVVFFARLVPGLRSLISIPAGISGMNLGIFLLYTALGASLWTGVLAYLGRVLGQNYDAVERYLGPVAYVVLGLLALAAALWALRRRAAKGRRGLG